MYKDRRFLLNSTALYLGISELEKMNVINITDPMKKELLGLQERFRRELKEITPDKNAYELYRILNRITIGGRV